jgi:hypothetical protein
MTEHDSETSHAKTSKARSSHTSSARSTRAVRALEEYELDDGDVETQRVISVFGSNTRGGYWEPPERLEVLALFGGAQLDFRDANLYSGVTVVNCLAMFGGIDILVPEELEVDANGTGVFGGFEQKAAKARKRRLFRGRERAPSPELELEPGEEPPLLVIRGFALFGGVTIRVR